MVDLIITAGQHRNEKSAIVLAPLVTKSLIENGYDVLLLFNPERKTFFSCRFYNYFDINKTPSLFLNSLSPVTNFRLFSKA